MRYPAHATHGEIDDLVPGAHHSIGGDPSDYPGGFHLRTIPFNRIDAGGTDAVHPDEVDELSTDHPPFVVSHTNDLHDGRHRWAAHRNAVQSGYLAPDHPVTAYVFHDRRASGGHR